MTTDLLNAVADFLARDWRADVERLNPVLAADGISADLVDDIPPIPWTGDPSAKSIGDCALVLGINPKWLGWDNEWAEAEYSPSLELVDRFVKTGDRTALNAYLDMRAQYFRGDQYYGQYFTAYGNRLAESFRTDLKGDPRELWHKWAMKMDVVPWFSVEDRMNPQAVANAITDDPGLLSYHKLVHQLVLDLRPTMLIVNGTGLARSTVEATLTDGDLSCPNPDDPAESRIFVGHAVFGGSRLQGLNFPETHRVPVLSHRFINAPGGNGRESWTRIAAAWRCWNEEVGEAT